MPHHNHEHSGSSGHTHGHGGKSGAARLLKDWRLWVGVVLVLAAMTAYILSMDESIQPAGPTGGGPGAATTQPSGR